MRNERIRDARRSRERLLTIAREAFAERGFDAVRVDDLAQAAGLNKRMIYHYFGSKAGLYRAVVEPLYEALRPAPDLEALPRWAEALRTSFDAQSLRLLAWDGLRQKSAPVPLIRAATARARDAADVSLLLLALTLIPAAQPRLSAELTGLDPREDAFAAAWQRLQSRLLGLIEEASRAPKPRHRLKPSTAPSLGQERGG